MSCSCNEFTLLANTNSLRLEPRNAIGYLDKFLMTAMSLGLKVHGDLLNDLNLTKNANSFCRTNMHSQEISGEIHVKVLAYP